MDNNRTIEIMNACDEQYLALFCTKGREWGLFVYQDRELPELPAHNFLRIPEHIPAGRLRGLCDVARNTANATGRAFLRIELSQPLHFNSAVSEQWGRYLVCDESAFEPVSDSGLTFEAIDSNDKAASYIEFSVDDGEDKQFARRRAERFSNVYLADNGLTCWLCRRGEHIVGCGELFIFENTAKIANVSVAADEYAGPIKSAFLSHLVGQGKSQGADMIYYYSADDVAGFIKQGDGYALKWEF